MNIKLRKEIIRQIFDRFGVMPERDAGYTIGALCNLTHNEYLLDKKIRFIGEENKEYQNKCWAASCEIGKFRFITLIADTSDDIQEFSILIQMDTMMTYALKLSADPEDIGSMQLHTSIYSDTPTGKWFEASTLMQGKCLAAIEGLSDQIINWQPIKNYKDIYDLLISFLKDES